MSRDEIQGIWEMSPFSAFPWPPWRICVSVFLFPSPHLIYSLSSFLSPFIATESQRRGGKREEEKKLRDWYRVFFFFEISKRGPRGRISGKGNGVIAPLACRFVSSVDHWVASPSGSFCAQDRGGWELLLKDKRTGGKVRVPERGESWYFFWELANTNFCAGIFLSLSLSLSLI